MTCDATTLTTLDELLAAINAFPDPRRASAEWKKLFKALEKADLLDSHAKHMIGMRDAVAMAHFFDELRTADAAPVASDAAIDEATLKRAMRAFRKRLSLTVLDDESKLGRSPLTKGADSSRATIAPPIEWSDDVWMALVHQGKLRYVGHGLFGLPQTSEHGLDR